jgi:hypothetical protein
LSAFYHGLECGKRRRAHCLLVMEQAQYFIEISGKDRF